MSDEHDFELSRRKALAGLGMVGVASAGAGLGTTAYFSDRDDFEDNTITAGEFGLTVEPGGYAVDQDRESQHDPWPGQVNWSGDYDLPDKGSGDEDPAFEGGSIDIVDAKPGDSYKFCWEITVHDNPGYVNISASGVEHLDGSETDANVDPENLYDTDELETLADNVDAYVKVYPGYGSDHYLSKVEYDNLGHLLESLENGVNIATSEEDPLKIEPDETIVVCVYLSIDADKVGNEIQGASTSADLLFYAEQSRHNDGFPSSLPDDENGNGDDGNDDDDDDNNDGQPSFASVTRGPGNKLTWQLTEPSGVDMSDYKLVIEWEGPQSPREIDPATTGGEENLQGNPSVWEIRLVEKASNTIVDQRSSDA